MPIQRVTPTTDLDYPIAASLPVSHLGQYDPHRLRVQMYKKQPSDISRARRAHWYGLTRQLVDPPYIEVGQLTA